MKARWTTAQIPDQHGRRVILTGANSGIGYPAALELARSGATVVLACRSRERGEAAKDRIAKTVMGAQVEVDELDLASLRGVRAFAERELARNKELHVLVNNAGVMSPPKRLETEDRFELQFGTNVLGHFALTGLLMPKLARAGGDRPRVVTVASIAHKRGSLNFTDLQYHGGYSPTKAYQQSKLANLVFALELDRRLRAAGSPVMSMAAHPGVANTNLFKVQDYGKLEMATRVAISHLIGLVMNTDAQGAIPTLFAATAKEAESGGYYGPQGLAETRGGDVGPAKVFPQARDAGDARKLWSICEELTGVVFLD